jgi:hypothetical protein
MKTYSSEEIKRMDSYYRKMGYQDAKDGYKFGPPPDVQESFNRLNLRPTLQMRVNKFREKLKVLFRRI